MRRLVVGDIHGGFKALQQVLERAGFDKDTDILMSVGDYADGWPQTHEVVEFLSTLPHFKGVMGNHDQYLLEFLTSGHINYNWLRNGGHTSLHSYYDIDAETEKRHATFLRSLPSHRIIDGTLICHGGVYYKKGQLQLDDMRDEDITWDRNLYSEFMSAYLRNDTTKSVHPFERVIIGHTTTTPLLEDMTPFHWANLWNIDQGGGWEGKLTLLDFDTEEYWQSDVVATLYPNERGRR